MAHSDGLTGQPASRGEVRGFHMYVDDVYNVYIRRVEYPVFKCEANGNYSVFECATVLGRVHKIGLHIVNDVRVEIGSMQYSSITRVDDRILTSKSTWRKSIL